MERAGAMPVERFQVFGRLVAFVTAEAVLRVNVVPFAHGAVAKDLGDDGGGGDGVAALVTLDDGELGEGHVEGEGVDEEVIGDGAELFDRQFHGQAGGVVDVDAVYSFGVNGGDGPGEGAFADTVGEDFAAFGFYFF